jgi:hypothetical protein
MGTDLHEGASEAGGTATGQRPRWELQYRRSGVSGMWGEERET